MLNNVYIINYDLNRPGQNYQDLYEAIKSLGDWWHCLDSTWIIHTSLNTAQVRERLTEELDQNDSLLVASLKGEAAWIGFSNKCSEWLTNKLQPLARTTRF